MTPSARDIPVADALERVLARAPQATRETLFLDRALGRTLAHDVTALADHPTVANSALDGYACRALDTTGASADRPVRLRVVGEVPAGRLWPNRIESGEAVAIYTGGAVPEGADAIVPVEATHREDDVVVVLQPARPEDIRPRAQDFARGAVGLAAGRRLDSAALALAAAMGHAELVVARRPRVGILTTGNELVAPGEPLRAGQVFDANRAGLTALVEAAGGEPVSLPTVKDEVDELQDALRMDVELDLILTSGGVSMGRFDLVRDLMFTQGEVDFWKVLLKPGGPTLFGTLDGIPLLGVPGNPVSSLVVFVLFGYAFVERGLGLQRPPPYYRRDLVLAGERLPAAGAKEALLRVRLEGRGPDTRAFTTGSQNSGVLGSMAAADALAIVPPHAAITEGAPVEILRLAPLLG